MQALMFIDIYFYNLLTLLSFFLREKGGKTAMIQFTRSRFSRMHPQE